MVSVFFKTQQRCFGIPPDICFEMTRVNSVFQKVFLFFHLFIAVDLVGQLDVPKFHKIKNEKHIFKSIWQESLTRENFNCSAADSIQNADVVILDSRIYMSIRTGSSNLGLGHPQRFLFRKAIYIKTKKGVEDFSTISIDIKETIEKRFSIGLRVYRVDGSIESFPEQTFEEHSDDWKMAVPDLNVGDVLEYFLFVTKYIPNYAYYISPEMNLSMHSQYPTLHRLVQITMASKFKMKFVNANSFSKPSIDYVEAGTGLHRITFEDDNLVAFEADSWAFMRRRSVPGLYVVLAYEPPYYDIKKWRFRSNTAYTVNGVEAVDKAFVKAKTDHLVLGTSESKSLSKRLIAEFDSKEPSFNSERERLEAFYKESLLSLRMRMKTPRSRYDSDLHMQLVAEYCRLRKIRSEWRLAPPFFLGELDDIASTQFFFPSLFVYPDGKDTLIYQSARFSHPRGMHSFLAGSECFVRRNITSKNWDYTVDRMPTTHAEENVISITMNLELDDNDLIGSIDWSEKGMENKGMDYDCEELPKELCDKITELLPIREMIDKSNFETTIEGTFEELSDIYRSDGSERGDIESAKENNEAMKRLFSNWVLNGVEKRIEEEFPTDIEEFDELVVHSTGGVDFGDSLSMTMPIRFDGCITRLGDKGLISLEELVFKTPDYEEERHNDIYLEFPFSRKSRISISLGQSQALGYESLRKTISNDIGVFVCAAEIIDNHLCIDYEFVIYHAYYPKDKWGHFLELFDAIDDLRKSKILLE